MMTNPIKIDVSEEDLTRDLAYGRRRGIALDDSVLDAAIEVLITHGVAGTSIAAVARQRGMGKTTIYRRFPNREALIAAAVARFVGEHVTIPDTGAVRVDLERIVLEATVLLRRPGVQSVAPELVAAANRDEEWASALRQRFVQPYQLALATVVDRGIRRGELRADVDAELLFDALIGALAYRAFVTRHPLNDQHAAALVEVVLDGATAR